MDRAIAAQIFNLLYRRASSLQSTTSPTRCELATPCRLKIGDTAD
jgi:hypothetical protein